MNKPQCPNLYCYDGVVTVMGASDNMDLYYERCSNPVHTRPEHPCMGCNGMDWKLNKNENWFCANCEEEAQVQIGTHRTHCFMMVQPENEFMGCKYGPDEDCPMYEAHKLAEKILNQQPPELEVLINGVHYMPKDTRAYARGYKQGQIDMKEINNG